MLYMFTYKFVYLFVTLGSGGDEIKTQTAHNNKHASMSELKLWLYEGGGGVPGIEEGGPRVNHQFESFPFITIDANLQSS